MITAVIIEKMRSKDMTYHRIAIACGEAVSTVHGRIWRLQKRCKVAAQRIDKEALLRTWITAVKTVRSTWGTRRVRAYLVKKCGFTGLGRKRVQRIMREQNLLCPRIQKRVHRKKPERITADAPNTLWATDMTSIMLSTLQRVYLIVVMDVFTRRIVGYHLSNRCRSREWILALEQAVHEEFPEGVRGKQLRLRSDNGSQPTSKAYVKTLETLDITGEWIGFNSPEQNGHIESLIGTLKQDFIWLEEYDTFEEAYQMIRRAVSEYNSDHPHSSLLYMSPDECKRQWDKGNLTINDKHQLEITQQKAA